ncbi:MAG: hypothetical protein HY810_02400 [Candidatus Omnitrophica bacterium]|nr:hypothetical protein [Candidatus Omnitrophota bacterium]
MKNAKNFFIILILACIFSFFYTWMAVREFSPFQAKYNDVPAKLDFELPAKDVYLLKVKTEDELPEISVNGYVLKSFSEKAYNNVFIKIIPQNAALKGVNRLVVKGRGDKNADKLITKLKISNYLAKDSSGGFLLLAGAPVLSQYLTSKIIFSILLVLVMGIIILVLKSNLEIFKVHAFEYRKKYLLLFLFWFSGFTAMSVVPAFYKLRIAFYSGSFLKFNICYILFIGMFLFFRVVFTAFKNWIKFIGHKLKECGSGKEDDKDDYSYRSLTRDIIPQAFLAVKGAKGYQWIIAAVVIINVVLKIHFIASNSKVFYPPGGDAAGFDYCAEHLLSWFFSPEMVRPPVYIFFLKFIYFLIGIFRLEKLPAVYFAHCLLDVGTMLAALSMIEIIFIKLKARNLLKITYAVCYTLYFPFIINSAAILRETLNNFLTALFLVFLLRFHVAEEMMVKLKIAGRKVSCNLKTGYLFTAAFFFTMTYLNREDNFLYLFFILPYFWYLHFFKKQNGFGKKAVFFLAVIALFNLPWLLRNIVFSREFVWLTKQGGLSIALGHMYDYPIFDDLRCPYLSDMAASFAEKNEQSGSGIKAAFYFVNQLWANHTFWEVFKFYMTKIINMFKIALILCIYPINLGFYTIYTTFINVTHTVFLRFFIISWPILFIYRRLLNPCIIYVIFIFALKILMALMMFGCPRYAFNMIPYMILFACFAMYMLVAMFGKLLKVLGRIV